MLISRFTLQACYPNTGSRVLTFLGGACSYGPGMVVDDDLRNPIRSHHDIEKVELIFCCVEIFFKMKHFLVKFQKL